MFTEPQAQTSNASPTSTARALIIAGGEAPPPAWLQSIHRPDDYVIAADSGFIAATRANLRVDFLLGDFDSLPQEYQLLALPPCQIKRFPADKDYSDGELALLEAHAHGASQALIVGALGGRLDHTLFNVIAILEKASLLQIRATLLSPHTCAFQLQSGESCPLGNYIGHTCSIIALDNAVTLSLQDMRYNLHAETIERSSTRGLSNCVMGKNAAIAIEEGRAIVVLTK